MSERPPEIPAATLVVFRRGRDDGAPELLMLERSRAMSFAGGMAVFPGGRVDEADRVLAAEIAGELEVEEAAHRIAAIRETIEETGLAIGLARPTDADEARLIREALLERGEIAPVLRELGQALDLATLVPFARWCPRGITSHRVFDTRFYLYDLGTGKVDVAVDATENTRLFWISAAGALALADAGELSVIFPTRRNLERLALFDSLAEAKAQAAELPGPLTVPRDGRVDGEGRPTPPEDLGYPVTYEFVTSAMRG